jgi:hypothetical protein
MCFHSLCLYLVYVVNYTLPSYVGMFYVCPLKTDTPRVFLTCVHLNSIWGRVGAIFIVSLNTADLILAPSHKPTASALNLESVLPLELQRTLLRRNVSTRSKFLADICLPVI